MRVVIADDAVLFREGLARVLAGRRHRRRRPGRRCRAAAARGFVPTRPTRSSSTSACPRPTPTRASRPPSRSAPSSPEVGVLVLSQYVEPHHALQLLQDGAGGVGYLLKDRVADVDELVDAVRRVAAGGSVIDPEVVAQLVGRRRTRDPIQELTERERQVLALMAEGRSNQAIGERAVPQPQDRRGATCAASSPGSTWTAAPDDHRRVLAVLAFLRA